MFNRIESNSSTPTIKVTMKKVMLLLTILLIAITGIQQAYALYTVDDKAAIEVVFNLENAKLDMETLKTIPGITESENPFIPSEKIYTYRSHVNKDIIVIISMQPITMPADQKKYPAIRVQSPLKTETRNETYWRAILTLQKEPQINEQAITALGWNLTCQENEQAKRCTIEKTVEDAKIEVYVSVTYNNGSVTTYIDIKTPKLTEQIMDEINALLQIMDIDETPRFERHEYYPKIPVPIYDEQTLKHVLEVELAWLLSNGILEVNVNITEILEAAKMGYAGWNSRLVHYSGKWYPYYEVYTMLGGTLLRTTSTASIPVSDQVPPWNIEKEETVIFAPSIITQLITVITAGIVAFIAAIVISRKTF